MTRQRRLEVHTVMLACTMQNTYVAPDTKSRVWDPTEERSSTEPMTLKGVVCTHLRLCNDQAADRMHSHCSDGLGTAAASQTSQWTTPEPSPVCPLAVGLAKLAMPLAGIRALTRL